MSEQQTTAHAGIDSFGNPRTLDEEVYQSMRSQCHPVAYRGQSLLDGLAEMFPDLSKSEIRRLVRDGALKGVVENATEEDLITYRLDAGWPEFEIVKLGKTQLGPRWGMFVKENA